MPRDPKKPPQESAAQRRDRALSPRPSPRPYNRTRRRKLARGCRKPFLGRLSAAQRRFLAVLGLRVPRGSIAGTEGYPDAVIVIWDLDGHPLPLEQIALQSARELWEKGSPTATGTEDDDDDLVSP